jgi:glycerol-3-phosphate dehydrogenase
MSAAASLPRADARDRALAALEAERFDLAVIGGGITGAGIAREAALRGLSVVLVEAGDYAAGTSSRSSKLIHGGLRYLALGDVATVRTTALERALLHRLAPHLAEPRWMLVPARSWAGLAKLRVGITAYEKLGAVAEPDLHRTLDAEALAHEEPALDRAAYPYACIYREYLTDDARLVLANLRSAAAAGAVVLSHAPARAIHTEGGAAAGLAVECAASGRRVRVRARAVVNAAGPWVDAVRALEDPAAPARLHLSKGVHVVLPAARLPLRNVAILVAADKRSIFAIPRGPVVYVGTTDTSYTGERRLWPEIERADVEYLLAPVARTFAVDPPRPADVVAAWAGLRPLIAEPGKPPAEISRRDEVWLGPAGVVTIAGGKLTGYRPMARAAVERAAEVAGLRPAPPPAEEPPLPGGDFGGDLDALAARVARSTGLAASCAARLVRLYGAEAEAVAALGADGLPGDADLVLGEVDWAVRHEGALDLEDLWYRRLRAALYHPAARGAGLEAAAARMAGLLGWSEDRRERELEAVRARLADDLAFQARGEDGR